MDCELVREQLSAHIDGQLEAETRAVVESHLERCAACRSECDALTAVHAALAETMRPERQRAPIIAERVIEHWRAETSTNAVQDSIPWRRWAAYLLAAAAGFTIAAAIFLHRPERKEIIPIANGPAALPARLPVAEIVRATGPLMFLASNTTDWETISAERATSFACRSDTRLRTDEASLCELSTPDGGRLRLSEQTEVAFRGKDDVELVTGQLWCKGPNTEALQITTDIPAMKPAVWTCPTGAEGLAISAERGPLRVMAAAGTVKLAVNATRETLEAGTVCSIDNGQVSVRQSSEELLIATRWMQPLLTLEGYNNPELESRVDALLSRIGRAKISYLFEQDLRSLGEFGALPLLRFVQSADADRERQQRQSAMRILRDTAPVWMTPEFISLLKDSDPVVRINAARTLLRLTGETQGVNPDDWQTSGEKQQTALAAWHDWWAMHSLACTPPPRGVQFPPRVIESKARN